jgi:DsbC/DsbD-like thiol-disulfide interchange protein
LSVLAGVVLVCAAHAEPNTSARLVADTAAIRPGGEFRLGVLFRMAPEWHIYWKNPGESGLATEVRFDLPDGFRASELKWPVPVRFVSPGPVVSYGYAGEVLLWATVRAPDALSAEAPVRLRAKVSWLECREACVPGEAELAVEVPVSSEPEPANRQLFTRCEERLPARFGARGVPFRAGPVRRTTLSKGGVRLQFELTWKEAPGEVRCFPAPPAGVTVESVGCRQEGARTRVRLQLAGSASAEELGRPLELLISWRDMNNRVRGVSVPVLVPGRQDAGSAERRMP